MRFLFRLIVLALAAFGAKALYDWLAPRREDLQRTGTDFVTRASSAARAVTGEASDAARNVAQVASDRAGGLAHTAAQQAHAVKDGAGDAREEAVG